MLTEITQSQDGKNTLLDISASTKAELFQLFFREYDNRYKYCNDLHYWFASPELQREYKAWRSNISNYANNGGDMT